MLARLSNKSNCISQLWAYENTDRIAPDCRRIAPARRGAARFPGGLDQIPAEISMIADLACRGEPSNGRRRVPPASQQSSISGWLQSAERFHIPGPICDASWVRSAG